MAGLDRARSRTAPFKIDSIRRALDEGRGIRETARLLKVSAAKVSEIKRMSAKESLPRFDEMRPGIIGKRSKISR
jgi:hypothetical protein